MALSKVELHTPNDTNRAPRRTISCSIDEENVAYLECASACHDELFECHLDTRCLEPDCPFWAMVCLGDCGTCPPLSPDHYVAYEGSCIIELPGPVPPLRISYTHILTHDEGTSEYDVWEQRFVTPQTCEREPSVGGWWLGEWPDYSSIELCPAVCELFELHGALSLEFEHPPCG